MATMARGHTFYLPIHGRLSPAPPSPPPSSLSPSLPSREPPRGLYRKGLGGLHRHHCEARDLGRHDGRAPRGLPRDHYRFERDLAVEVIRQNENDTQLALNLLTDPNKNSALQHQIGSRNKAQRFSAYWQGRFGYWYH